MSITDKVLGLDDTLWPPTVGVSLASYIEERIRTNIEPASPYMAQKIKTAVSLILSSTGKPNWTAQSSLPRLDDGGNSEVQDLKLQGGDFENCRMVQIAIRYQKSVLNNSPLIFVDYDQDLYERLGGNNPEEKIKQQASLILHEALYLMEVDAGILNSAAVRNVNSLLFSRKTETSFQLLSPVGRRGFILQVFDYYGFHHFWWAFLDKSAKPSVGTFLSRQLSKAQLEDKLQAIRKEITNSPDLLLENEERNKVLVAVVPKLTQEEAFILLTEILFKSEASRWHPDSFLLESDDSELASKGVCSQIRGMHNLESKASLWQFLLKTSRDYCGIL